MSAFEARRNFGKMLREVETTGNSVVVERNGEPVAAVVPIELYERWKKERTALFASIRQAAQRVNLSEDEAMTRALEAQQAARAQ